MAGKNRYKSIKKFLETKQSKSSKLLTFVGLTIGMFLLLLSVQMFININDLIKEKSVRKNGFDYISVTKAINNNTMGDDNRFSKADVEELKSQPFIEDAAPLISNQFRAKASAGNIIPFSTDLFLETIKNDFLDTVPENFTWKQGQTTVPILMSAEYLEMYNVFAPAQDLPQISPSTAGTVNIQLECYTPTGMINFRGNIVGLSDRINSVIVPESFLVWANKNFGNVEDPPAARVYIKTKDANSVDLMNFLTKKNYYVNKDKIKFGRVKQVLQGIVGGLGIFAILVVLLAMLLFSYYLQLMIARSKDNLQLMLTLGYSPKELSKTVAKKWLPTYIIIIIVALALTQIAHLLFRKYSIVESSDLSAMIHPIIFVLAAILFVLCMIYNYSLVKKELNKL